MHVTVLFYIRSSTAICTINIAKEETGNSITNTSGIRLATSSGTAIGTVNTAKEETGFRLATRSGTPKGNLSSLCTSSMLCDTFNKVGMTHTPRIKLQLEDWPTATGGGPTATTVKLPLRS